MPRPTIRIFNDLIRELHYHTGKTRHVASQIAPLIFIKRPEPVAELPNVAHHVEPRWTILAISRPESPLDVHGGRNRKKRRPAIPIPGNQPKIKPHQRPPDREMSHKQPSRGGGHQFSLSTIFSTARFSHARVSSCRFCVWRNSWCIWANSWCVWANSWRIPENPWRTSENSLSCWSSRCD